MASVCEHQSPCTYVRLGFYVREGSVRGYHTRAENKALKCRARCECARETVCISVSNGTLACGNIYTNAREDLHSRPLTIFCAYAFRVHHLQGTWARVMHGRFFLSTGKAVAFSSNITKRGRKVL